MHKPENYWLHKTHHKVHEELNAIHTHRIDSIDVFLENGIGLALFMIGQYAICGRVNVHLCAFYYVGYADTVIHSVNPYSIVHFNPILDYYCKPNMEHNLHHILQDDYYVFHSFRHILDIKNRDEDLKKYNQLCGTNISFDLFI